MTISTVSAYTSCYTFTEIPTNYSVSYDKWSITYISNTNLTSATYYISSSYYGFSEYWTVYNNLGDVQFWSYIYIYDVTDPNTILFRLGTQRLDPGYFFSTFTVCINPSPTPSPTPTPTIPITVTPTITATGTSTVPGECPEGNSSCTTYQEGDYVNIQNNSLPSDSHGFKELAEGMGYQATVGGYLSMMKDYMFFYILVGFALFMGKLWSDK